MIGLIKFSANSTERMVRTTPGQKIPVLEISLEKPTPEIQVQQESKDEIKASQKTTKITRRQPPNSSQPGKDVSDKFNKY